MKNSSLQRDSQTFTGIFNDSFPPIIDGVTLTVQNYVRVLNEKGMSPLVVTPRNPEAFETDFPVLRYFSLPITSRHPYRYGYPKLDFTIWRKLRRTPFRIIHSHSPFSAGRLAVYAAKHQRVPLVATFHSKYRDDLQHSFRRTPWMVDIIMRRILNFFNACDHVWIPQAAVEETVREYGYRGPLTVVENGNDLASQYPEEEVPMLKEKARKELGIPQSAISLLFVGQHILEKGIDVIAQTLELLDGDTDFRMHFIGNGYAQADLQTFLRERGLTEKVTIHGIVKDRKLLALHYAAADLFLFPSLYDNAPLVIREAAALMTPAILVEGSTAAEVIRDGYNGFLCTKNPQEYAALIHSLHADRHRIAEVGRNARHTLTRTWDNIMDEVLQNYELIISKYKRDNSL